MMKQLRLLLISMMVLVLLGCSHGYEGTYKVEVSSVGVNLGELMPDTRIVIGRDYLESDGERTQLDDIFVRESGGSRYLVLKTDGKEDAWKIIDDTTLERGNGFAKARMTRVE
ncbi:hypothetical protein [Marinobacterium weihaiense]|uniref:DUF3221 domain-containing protein n=1 Tax=Marinobacterium weihaiense TaxID=2851016 RepID=A0ABS6MAB0_9GAMM|nr:hypothetical protein [Marinobacterium weihaiense]MBV0932839.1 hypothetical protein [Marinobacterium weihaiense]